MNAVVELVLLGAEVWDPNSVDKKTRGRGNGFGKGYGDGYGHGRGYGYGNGIGYGCGIGHGRGRGYSRSNALQWRFP